MLKYIRTEKLGIIIFRPGIDHKAMWEKVETPDDKIISAGLIGCVDEDMISCIASSVTLQLSALPEDTVLLRRSLI